MENESTPTPSAESKKSMSPMMIGAIIVLVVILAGAAYFLTKKSMKSAPITPTANNEVPTTAQPTVAAPTATTPSGAMKADTTAKSFIVEGSNFKFVPATLSVKMGDTVKITFKDTQGMHNFMIDEFNATSKTIQANQTDELTFVASKKGTFEYYCSVGKHRAMGMVGTLTVN